MTPSDDAARFERALKRGALFNLLGGIGKLLQPLSLLSLTWLFGPALTGQYLLGYSLLEIASGGATAGFADGATIFTSRLESQAANDAESRHALGAMLANAFAFAGGLSLLVALAAFLFGRTLIARTFPAYGELLPGLYALALALLPRALGAIAIAATKGKLHMQHDALLNGFVHPALTLLGYLAIYATRGGLGALFCAQLLVEIVVCVLSLRAFARYFSLRELMAAFRGFALDRGLLAFAVPQSFNLTFNRYIARLDAIMLAAFGLGQAELGYFGTAAMLTGNLGQIRIIFSGALGPILARHHARGEAAEFQAALSQVARWTCSLIVPVVLLLAVLRADLLGAISSDYGDGNPFVVVLLIPPLTNCAFGMAGACLMFTGHTRVTLANSFCIALLNTAFTYWLIPQYGMLGAALATALASSLITGLQMVELWWLERVTIPLAAVWKPLTGLLLGALMLATLWDPAGLPLPIRIAAALGVTLGYAALLLLLRHEEMCRMFGFRVEPDVFTQL